MSSGLPPIRQGSEERPEAKGTAIPLDDDSNDQDFLARHVLEELAMLGMGGGGGGGGGGAFGANRTPQALDIGGSAGDASLEESIRILSAYRDRCEGKKRYREAEVVTIVLKHLFLEQETRHVRGLEEQHEEERLTVEAEHANAFEAFHARWNRRIDDLEERQLEAEGQLLERHAQELSLFRAEVARAHPRGAKLSKSLMELRKMQETLAGMRKYADAERVKRQGDSKEAVEQERLARERGGSFEKKEERLLWKHRQELAALRKRMERQQLELERCRKRELEMLLQRYTNVRRDLEAKQNGVRTKTGMMLLRHAANGKTSVSGSDAIAQCMGNGVFGVGMRRRMPNAPHDAAAAHENDMEGANEALPL